MGLLLQLVGALSLFVAGFELWRFLVGAVFTLILKAGLLSNITVDPHTKLSVTAAVIKISFWTQLWKFLRSPRQEKLIVLELQYVHLQVVKSSAESVKTPSPKSADASPPFWKTLDTDFGLMDLRHPVWKSARAWIPRLLFMCRCVHAVELGVHSISVDVVQQDKDAATPVLSIQHGSIYVSAMFHTEELSFTAKLSQSQPMKIHIQQLDATVALGGTEISARVNLDFENLVLLALHPKQQHAEDPRLPSNSDEVKNAVGKIEVLTVLRLAEITPCNLRCEIRKVEIKRRAL
ncbi:uncharacterized protein KRP23_1102 [Phytophthora ramorum]|uniref:uncharacterized protein n=1 Tax=Phytophthora ramorum TaxID=164328 RepID=UPI0030ADD871|nr:hypothetical protein KRP23_1102 [Phytophthora ramorum]